MHMIVHVGVHVGCNLLVFIYKQKYSTKNYKSHSNTILTSGCHFMFSLVHNMSRSNAMRCDWLRARCLAPRQPHGVSSQILKKRSRCAASSSNSALFITWYLFYSSEDGRETVYLYKIWPYTYVVEGYVIEEAFGCVQYFGDGLNEGSSITFCKKCACSIWRLSATTRKQAHSFNEFLLTVNFTLRNSL